MVNLPQALHEIFYVSFKKCILAFSSPTMVNKPQMAPISSKICKFSNMHGDWAMTLTLDNQGHATIG